MNNSFIAACIKKECATDKEPKNHPLIAVMDLSHSCVLPSIDENTYCDLVR